MTDRSSQLREYIDGTKGAPVIGVDDCGPWAARWIEIATGRKIAFPSYTTPAEAYAMAAAAGGLVELVSPLLAAVGLWETQAPALGDVGIIRLSDRDTAAIFVGNGICALRDERDGVRYMRPRNVLKAWTLP